MVSNKPPNQQLRLHKLSSLPDLFSTVLSLIFLFPPSKSHNLLLKIPNLSFLQNPRRLLLKPLTMHPSSSTQKTKPSSNSFSTPQSLSDWLKPRLPSDSFASWGVKPGTKNVHNLWLELSEGETSLLDSTPPVRTVNVVTVRIIGSDGRNLLESLQELSDGTIRERSRPLSEKMKPGETVDVAVMRAVREELGSVIQGLLIDGNVEGIVRIVPGSYRQKVEERLSASYPGLPACYVLHSVDAWVEGLPEEEFCTEEEEYGDCDAAKVANKAVVVKKHFWKWVLSDSDSA